MRHIFRRRRVRSLTIHQARVFSPSQSYAYTRNVLRGCCMSTRRVSTTTATRLMPHSSPWSPHSKIVRVLDRLMSHASLLTVPKNNSHPSQGHFQRGDGPYDVHAENPRATPAQATPNLVFIWRFRRVRCLSRFLGLDLRLIQGLLASPIERPSSRTLPRLRSRFWIRLYRSCLMSVVPCSPQINLASLIRTRCVHVLRRRKSAMKRADVKYISFEKE